MRTLFTPAQRVDLVRRYSEPFRVYHNLEHITVIFQLAAAHGVKLSIPQQIAIWFHDAVYFAGSSANEQASAELMKRVCLENSWIAKSWIDRAYSIILSTKNHQSADNETQTVIDLDLAGLGFDPETYYAAASQVRVEYSHFTELQWLKSRSFFLKELLNREHIFNTPWGRDFYEQKARRNMQTELDSINKQLSNLGEK